MDAITLNLLRYVPPESAYTVLGLSRQLPTLREEDDLRAFLLGLQHLLMNGVSILVALSGHGGFHPKFHRVMNVGWSEVWIKLYLESGFEKVDPVLNGPLDTEIVWSNCLSQLNPRSPTQRKFWNACVQHGMTQGITYAHDFGTHRVTISLAGAAAERDQQIRQVMSLMQRYIASTASRILAPQDLLYELSDVDMVIVDALASGQSDCQTADRTGLSVRAVRRHIKQMCSKYEASSRTQLIYKIFVGYARMPT